jgi:multidrug efflux pump subunit AcrA (membrane-fusion protein)
MGAHGALKPVIVRTGISDGTETEVLDGVTEGMAVVTATVSGGTAGSAFSPPQGAM